MRQIVVAKSAGTILYVRFQVKYRVPEFVVSLSRKIRQALNDRPRFAHYEPGDHLVVQAVEKRPVSGQIAAIEKRDRELDVVGIEFFAFR